MKVLNSKYKTLTKVWTVKLGIMWPKRWRNMVEKSNLPINSDVADVFNSYPQNIKSKLMFLNNSDLEETGVLIST